MWFFGMPSKVGTNDCDEVRLTMFIGHKHLYKSGVLHRDISPGNILIRWRPGSETTSGCLIDLDHAKRGKLVQDEVKTSVDDKMIDFIQTGVHVVAHVEVEKEVARRASEFFPNNALRTLTYLDAALAHASKFPIPNGTRLLGWKPVWALLLRFLSF